MLATNASSVIWLVVAVTSMLSMYVSTCVRMSEAVAVVTWAGARSIGPAVFTLTKARPRCLFALLTRFAEA